MPKRTDIRNILLIGSGPIIIGQACEFDYSGTQAAKTLKEQGYKVILINSNPATIMTDPCFADKTYIEPITQDIILDIIKKENIDAILPTMGGQTALNVAMQLHRNNHLKNKNIKFLGAKPEAIKKGEDRQAFKDTMIEIGVDIPKSAYIYNLEDALKAIDDIGFPAIIRASYTLAGGGSGIAYNIEEFKEIIDIGLSESPINEVLIEESLLGWKEFEMEVIRDNNDNCIIVCAIENVDPMGVHTGDSITVAPALTLTDKEYQHMRNVSFSILRKIGIDTGGSNVQFAINPRNGRMVAIEMNPRVSRSSALASKATGYPIAKVATLLAIGYSLDEIQNDITKTAASFEPSIDYIVTKIPRFTFDKFPSANSTLMTAMKSVGEVMAIGVTFKESVQKALCSLECNLFGFEEIFESIEQIKAETRRPNEKRLLYVGECFRRGLKLAEVFELSNIDPWFLQQIKEIIDFEKKIDLAILSQTNMLRITKSLGFSDQRIANIINNKNNMSLSANDINYIREKKKIFRSYNLVDTCAGEFPSKTPYLYSTFNYYKPSELMCDKDKKVLIIGSGPNRIGQGIEFDYCCVHAAYALREMGIKSIMYNCNPETVSTDYDTSDILYFDPINLEFVKSVIDREKPYGVILHFGGQTPLKLAKNIAALGVQILGTTAQVIDMAENREKFNQFIKDNKLMQPPGATATERSSVLKIATELGFPVLVRPSYVLGGAGMRIVDNYEQLEQYLGESEIISPQEPLLIDKFLNKAIELDVDCISDKHQIYIGGIMEHIEAAGIHSGDSASSLPPHSLSKKKLAEIKRQSQIIAKKLGVIGLMNIQFAVSGNNIYIIEVNPRASRTVPFVSKATGTPLAKVATKVMLGQNIKTVLKNYGIAFKEKDDILTPIDKKSFAIKESVLPFKKLSPNNLFLGPEMLSIGEVMGISDNFGLSYAKAQEAVQNVISNKKDRKLFISLCDDDKKEAAKIALSFIDLGYEIYATVGTKKVLDDNNIPSTRIFKIGEERPNIEDVLKNTHIDLIINTTDSYSSQKDSRRLMQLVLRKNLSYTTTISGAKATIKALEAINNGKLNHAKALQDYLAKN